MSADIELNWEWPAERTIEDRMLIQINSIKQQGSGFLGINKSPSLAANLPDPLVVSGVVIDSNSKLNGKSVRVIAPKLEIENIKQGSYAMLGIVEKSVCICIVPVENKESDLSGISCL